MRLSRSHPQDDKTIVPTGLSPFRTQRITWTEDTEHPGLERARIDVPLDYADPAGRRITVAISRRPATSAEHRRGVLLLVNGGPGGDGGPGCLLPNELAGTRPSEVYDLIGFDPRGTGMSTRLEAETTVATAGFDSRPPDSAFEAITADMRERDQGCLRAGGDMRPFVNTRNNARDMDLIREVLGELVISFVGWAYGSRLGAAYGAMFPEHLDRSVLDSSVHPDWDWRQQFTSQAMATRENVDIWAEWTGARHSRFGLGPSGEQVLERVEEVAAALASLSPNRMHRTMFDGLIGTQSALRPRWAELAEHIAELGTAAKESDADGCLRMLSGQTRWRPGDAAGGLREAVLEAVTCETPWPQDLDVYYRDMREYRELCPYGFGVMRVQPWVGTFHTFTVSEPFVHIGRRGYPRGLVVQADHDPLDYHVGATAMAERLEACLVEVVDSGAHEIYALGGNREVDAIVNAYLVHGVLPADRVRCRGESRPDIPEDIRAAETHGLIAQQEGSY